MFECFRFWRDCFIDSIDRFPSPWRSLTNTQSQFSNQCFVHFPYIGLMEKKFIDEIKLVCYSGTKILIVTKSYEVYGLGPLPGSDIHPNIFELRPIYQLEKKKVKKFVFGEKFVIALTKQGEVYSWGDNQQGQLGMGNNTQIGVPTIIQSLVGKKVIDVACGLAHVVVLCSNREAYCWGKYLNENYNNPKLISTNVRGIAASSEGCFFSTFDGKIFGLGQLQLKLETCLYSLTELICHIQIEKSIINNTNVKKLACGKHHVIALLDCGDLGVWGDEYNGLMKDLKTPTEFQPGIPEKVIDIAANSQSNLSAAMTASFRIFVWGKHQGGYFSKPTLTSFTSFEEVFTNFSDPNMTYDSINFKKHKLNRNITTGALESIFDVKDDSDYTINVENKDIHVHKVILKARSQYFHAMFTNNWKENENGTLKIEDYGYESFRDYLSYLYTGKINITEENVFELMSISDRYVDETLKELIEKKIETESLSGEVIGALKGIMKLSSPNYEKFCEGMRKMMIAPKLEENTENSPKKQKDKGKSSKIKNDQNMGENS